MCKFLGISRSNYYTYQEKPKKTDPITEHVKRIFRDNKKTYGTRRIKADLTEVGYQVSRRRIGRIMAEEGLVSVYTVTQYKVYKTSCNQSEISNELNREFHDKNPLEAFVSYLTYVRVKQKWHYICTIMDLHNREIIGYSAGPNKDAILFMKHLHQLKKPITD